MDCIRRILVVLLSLLATKVKGHGRLMDPPSRNAMWRYGYHSFVNGDDMSLDCGGFNTQWYINNGKCGICGDSYSQTQPRNYEAGGRYATGTIVKHYKEGQTITTLSELTVNHGGWFEFRICPYNDIQKEATQHCLDSHVLTLRNGSTRYYFPKGGRINITVELVLPRGLTCTQCVLQWLWNTASNNNCNYNNKCCSCGPQEQFVNCADVAITSSTYSQPHLETGTGSGLPAGFQQLFGKRSVRDMLVPNYRSDEPSS